MGTRKQQPGHPSAGADTDHLRVGRDYVEEVQRRVARLNETIEKKTETYFGDAFVSRQRQHIQHHMAQLRSEALQARRLAEQIHNLSQDGTAQKRNPVMNDTSMVDPGRARRASDKPRASGSQSSFNPLHPSMELPPEQLIRLLGLEGKKTRKNRKPAAAERVAPAKEVIPPKEAPPAADPTDRQATSADRVSASRRRSTKTVDREGSPARSPSRRSYGDEAVFQTRGKGLLLPAIAVGALTGIAVSAYLFWWQPTSEQTAAKPVAAVKPPVTAKTIPPKKTTAVIAAPAKTQATSAPIERKQPATVNDPQWRAAVQAQEQRVRAAAEQRLQERVQTARHETTDGAGNAEPVAPIGNEPLNVVPARTFSAPPEGPNPGAVTVEAPSIPTEQPTTAATSAPAETRFGAPMEPGMPSAPEQSDSTRGEDPAELSSTTGSDPAIEAVSRGVPAAENGPSPSATDNEPSATLPGDEPQPSTTEITDPQASF